MSLSCRIREHVRSNVYGIVAVFIALGGTAYAVDGPNPGQNTIGSEDIIGNEVKSDDIGNGRIFNLDIADDIIQSGKIQDGTIAAADIGSNAVGLSEIQTNGVGASEVTNGAIDSGEIADNTLTSDDLGTGSVHTAEILDGTIANADLANNAVDGAKVANNSLTQSDIAGADTTGNVDFGANSVPNGRCEHVGVNVGAAMPGDVVLFSPTATPPEGMLITAVDVPAAGDVNVAVCNFTGGAMPAITDLPVRVITFG